MEEEDLLKKYTEAVERVGEENITVAHFISAGTTEQILECKRRRKEMGESI